MRWLLPALVATVLLGAAIASADRRESPSRAVLLATHKPAPAPESVPQASGTVLAEMTRRLGTPRRVSREARKHARELARSKARRRARAAAADAAAAKAQTASSPSPGYWFDSSANAASSSPSSPAENAWLQGGQGGWVEASGYARAPANAPDAVKRIIAAGNQIARAPYVWGGGHGKWQDSGYDCSGSVSYALAYAGMLGYSLTSGQLMDWGDAGPGRWVTVYANEGHVFMYVAGLRFDTSGRQGDHSSRWQLAPRSADGFVARHYPGL